MLRESYFSATSDKPLVYETIGACFDRIAHAFPERDALIVRHQNVRWTYRKYKTEIDRLAAGLLSIGICKGDRVGIWAPNCYEWCLTQFATAKIGAILVCINPAYRVFELEFALNKSGCVALVTAQKYLTSDYAGMNDPQLLGQAVSLCGLLVALRQPPNARAMVVSALLCVLAIFIKHNLVLLPLSLAAWLLLADRRHVATFVASGVIFTLIGLGLFRTAFGTTLFHQIASPRLYTPGNVAVAIANWLPWAALPLCGAVLLFAIGRRDRYAGFATIYAAISVIGGILLAGGAGVDANVLFDADIALALCAGLLLSRLEYKTWSGWLAFAYVIPLALMLRTIEGDWSRAGYWLHPMQEDRLVAAAEISLLRSRPDPVLCEMLSLCYWAGHSAEVDVFNVDQSIRTGARPDTELVRQIEAKRFSMIELESLAPFPIAGRVEHALMRSYKIVRNDDGRVFFAPR
jgi:hypothetical protein